RWPRSGSASRSRCNSRGISASAWHSTSMPAMSPLSPSARSPCHDAGWRIGGQPGQGELRLAWRQLRGGTGGGIDHADELAQRVVPIGNEIDRFLQNDGVHRAIQAYGHPYVVVRDIRIRHLVYPDDLLH